MASGNFTTSNTSNRTEHRGGYEQAPTDNVVVASAPPTISSQDQYQDAPPTYDEAVLGYDKTFNGEDKLHDQNELPFKGNYNPQLDPGLVFALYCLDYHLLLIHLCNCIRLAI